jgi:hypothetical protein
LMRRHSSGVTAPRATPDDNIICTLLTASCRISSAAFARLESYASAPTIIPNMNPPMTIAIVQANISYIVFGVMSPYPTVVIVITAQSDRSSATFHLPDRAELFGKGSSMQRGWGGSRGVRR